MTAPRPVTVVIADHYVNFARKDIAHAFRTLYPNRRIQLIGPQEALRKRIHIDVIIFFGQLGTAMRKQNCPKILFSGEPTDLTNRGPCSLVVDCKDVPSRRPAAARFSYYPFYVRSLSERGHNNVAQLIKGPGYAAQTRRMKTKFCAFLYSHDAEPRNQFFHLLSGYKQVDALGNAPTKFRGPRPPKRKDRGSHDTTKGTYNDGAVSCYTPYKFVIAFENSSHTGYVTEKIINPMFAGAIPIYWGAPDVGNHFNPHSFVDANGPDGLTTAIEKIKEIDQNDDIYEEMLSEPWLPNNQVTHYLTNPQNYFADAIKGSVNLRACSTALTTAPRGKHGPNDKTHVVHRNVRGTRAAKRQ